MDKATKERFRMITEHYQDVARELNISLQELLLLVISEQLTDIFVKNSPEEGLKRNESDI